MRISLQVTVFPALSETFVLNQIEGLLERGHEIDVQAIRRGGDRVPSAIIENRQVVARTLYRGRQSSRAGQALRVLAAGTGLLLRSPTAFLRLRRAVARAPRISFGAALVAARNLRLRPPPDVVYAHFGPNGLLYAALRAAGLVTAPLVTVFHGYDLSLFLRWEGQDCYRLLFEEGALMLPVSEEFARRLRAMGCPPERIRVHHMGVDPGSIPYRERRRAPGTGLELLSIARLVEKKGIDHALRALATVAPDVDWHYRIVGDGPLRAELEALAAELGIAARVDFLGWRDNAEVKTIIAECQVLLAPSVTAREGDEEGIPVVLMEAAAGGLAIVSTRHSGIPELVRDGVSGLLADERDVAGLGRAIERLARDQELALDLGRHGRELVEAEFDIAVLNRRLVAMLEEIVEACP